MSLSDICKQDSQILVRKRKNTLLAFEEEDMSEIINTRSVQTSNVHDHEASEMKATVSRKEQLKLLQHIHLDARFLTFSCDLPDIVGHDHWACAPTWPAILPHNKVDFYAAIRVGLLAVLRSSEKDN